MGYLEERDMKNAPTIPEYYKGKTVFITGGSGFMGKVLIEKLLYSCTDLERIYLLLRNKKGVNAEDRLNAIYSSHCFDRLRKEKPDVFESKVFFIAGDASEVGLGMSEEDRTLIINRTNILFHVAASVRFDDSLKVAARLNLRGTKEVVELAKDMQHLEANPDIANNALSDKTLKAIGNVPARTLLSFVHVSTAYANTTREEIDEVVYPPFADWRETLEICEKLDDQTLAVLTPKYLSELPNTYVFTKQLAEHVVYEQKGKLPVVIFRPAIVVSSVEEPLEGWIENFNGPVGLLIACGKGILRSCYSNPDIRSDYIPVDVVIKQCITASWIRGTKKLEESDDVEVYNCSTSHLTTMTLGEIIENGKNLMNEVVFDGVVFPAGGSITRFKIIHYVKVLFLHLLPAIILDGILKLSGRKPMLVKVQRRIYTANMAVQYYIMQQWKFLNRNFLALRAKLKNEDLKSFHFSDLTPSDQKVFYYKAALASKVYLLNEKLEDMPKAKAHLKRIQLVWTAASYILYSLVFWIVINSRIFNILLGYAFSMIL